MKKIIVLAALVTLVATSAFGAISGTAHDLSGKGTGTTEICAFCHTPHSGTTQAPLWNRGAGPGVVTEYNSSTMNATSGSASSDASLCLSCHDSTAYAGTVLTNVPNGSTYVPGSLAMTSVNAIIGTNLSNDHPVGFAYADSTADAGIRGTIVGSNVQLFSLTAAKTDVWCSSCHDVHDNTVAPFLVQSNANSALCLACHNK